MDTEDIKKYRQILSEAWATDADKKRGLVRHGPKPADVTTPTPLSDALDQKYSNDPNTVWDENAFDEALELARTLERKLAVAYPNLNRRS